MRAHGRIIEIGVFILWLNFFSHSSAFAEITTQRKDLDGDGTKESKIFYENGTITKVMSDYDGNGKADVLVYYKNGFRDRAEIDVNGDGKSDTWVDYYFTGVPEEIRVDRNRDGKPDEWKYFKNGFIYKREWDKNFDGVPDHRMLFAVKDDFRMTHRSEGQPIEIQYDADFDGKFEKVLKTKKKSRTKRVGLAPGNVEEEDY